MTSRRLRLLMMCATSIALFATLAFAACEPFSATSTTTTGAIDAQTPPLDVNAGDADAGPLCARVDQKDLLLCDDFNELDAGGDGFRHWAKFDNDDASTYGLNLVDFVSAPASAQLEIAAGKPGDDARLQFATQPAMGMVSIEGRAKVLRLGTKPRLAFVNLTFQGDGSILGLIDGTLRQSNPGLDGGSAVIQDDVDGAVAAPKDAWFSFALSFDLTKKEVTLAIDGKARTVAIDPKKTPATISVLIGPAESESATSLLYDDIVIRGTRLE